MFVFSTLLSCSSLRQSKSENKGNMFETKKVINCGRNNKSKRKKKKYPLKNGKKFLSVNLSKGHQNATERKAGR
jgi:hypothetical protein